MGKKSKRNRSTNSLPGSKASADGVHTVAPALRPKAVDEVETRDNLKFEDPYIEEYNVEEEDAEWEDADDDDDEVIEDTDVKMERANDDDDNLLEDGKERILSWNPLTGDPLDSDMKLEMDPTAYKMYHAMSPEWPALSFDFVRDEYGESRTRFPHKIIAAVGTQADRPENNQLTIIKVSDMAKMPNENDDDILGEEIDKEEDNNNDNESDSDDDDDEIDMDPIMEHYSIKHHGGVNRVRVMPQRREIVATWSDTGKVNLYNIESILQRFDISEGKPTKLKEIPNKPFFTYQKHGDEGFAMDWSRVNQGQLVTGACNGTIHVWKPRPEGGYEVNPFFSSNKSMQKQQTVSVEDLQWSPTEATVFASAECGGYVRIFDTRAPNRAMIDHKIHKSTSADVNVLSWNKLVSNLLATGGDDGSLSVWDLRHFAPSTSTVASDPKPLARFTPHKTPITSVEWHPTDESMLAASDDVGSFVYDLSVEEDTAPTTTHHDVPPQLLFVHSGSEQFKEIHWHPQIPSCLMTTALSGFSIFIPSNL